LTHVGNDIVDLCSPYVTGKSRDKKFIQRVLTPEEQKVVLNAANPDSLLQVYWAARETAYKVIVKTNPDVSSAPRRYRVLLDSPENGRKLRGVVKTPAADVFITVLRHRGFIHCSGATLFCAAGKIIYGIEKITDHAPPDFCRSSEAVSCLARTFAKEKIAAALSVNADNITITKTDGRNEALFPEVYINMRKTDIGISLSHDGRYVAFALAF